MVCASAVWCIVRVGFVYRPVVDGCVTGIWTNTGEGWKLGSPQAFQDEAALHRLIEQNPQLLPLAGSPRLAVLGSQVQLGTGYVDILAVESSGRPAIVEVKLAGNPEARRAVVSQVMAYAAFLHGFNVESLEQGPLRSSLADAGYGTILEAVQAQDQEGAADDDSFETSLQEFLNQGSFRLVLVLDEVPAELERVVAYLDAITVQALTIDLVVFKVYEVNGAQVALPQRVSPDIGAAAPLATPAKARPSGNLSDGPDAFRASIEKRDGETRTTFDELIAWAEQLAELPNVRLFSYAGAGAGAGTGTGRYTLLPRTMLDNAGLGDHLERQPAAIHLGVAVDVRAARPQLDRTRRTRDRADKDRAGKHREGHLAPTARSVGGSL